MKKTTMRKRILITLSLLTLMLSIFFLKNNTQAASKQVWYQTCMQTRPSPYESRYGVKISWGKKKLVMRGVFSKGKSLKNIYNAKRHKYKRIVFKISPKCKFYAADENIVRMTKKAFKKDISKKNSFFLLSIKCDRKGKVIKMILGC